MVICIALGSSQGAHDGLGTLSTYVSNISNTPQIGIIVAAGNEGNKRRHYSGRINPAIGYDTVELNVGENETGFSMELWGRPPTYIPLTFYRPR